MNIDQEDTNLAQLTWPPFQQMPAAPRPTIPSHPAMNIDQEDTTLAQLTWPPFQQMPAAQRPAIPSHPAMNIDQEDTNLAQLTWTPFQQTPTAPRPAIPSTNVENLVAVLERKRKWQAISTIAVEEPKAKKQKLNKKYSDGRSVLVRAFARRGEEFHVAEAEIILDSDGAFAVDYVAAKLLLKGTLYVSDILFGKQ